MIALVQAHTHGVNWELVGALFGPTIGLLIAIAKWLDKRLHSLRVDLAKNAETVKGDLVRRLVQQDQAQATQAQEVTRQHAEIAGRVSGVERTLNDLRERTARLEGAMQRTEKAVKSE